MSEYQQVLACFLSARRWLDSVRDSNQPLSLRRLWVDDTAKPKQAQDGRKQAGYVRALDGSYEIPADDTTFASVYPPEPWRGPNSKPLHSLSLQEVGSTPRSLVLHMKHCYLQVQLPSHILCQALTREQWETSVAQVLPKNRTFFVAFALDFGENGLLAFITSLNPGCLKVDWFTALEDLPIQCADVYTDYTRFLQGVATWICHRYHPPPSRNQDGLAISAIQEADTVFGGMGPYTVNEVFLLAGLSPFLTEQEIFKCPSRVARLCEGFWSFAHNAHITLPKTLEGCYDGLLLNPSVKQRLDFCRQLRVHGQQELVTSLRAAQLAQRYEARVQSIPLTQPFMRDAIGGLFDVFEPTYLQAALQKRGSSPNLSHLVFGPIEWRIHGGTLPKALDPLTMALWELGHPPDGPTNLDLSRYRSQRFLSAEEMTKARVSCHLYEGPDSTTALWSITPQIPLSYRDAQTSARRWQGLHPVHDVEPRLGQYIIENTRDCFVGPLEHCGMELLMRPSTNSSVPRPESSTPAKVLKQTMSTPVRLLERNFAFEFSSQKAATSKRKVSRPSLDFHVVRTPTAQAEVEPKLVPPIKRRRLSVIDVASEARRLGLLEDDVFQASTTQRTNVQQISAKLVGDKLWQKLHLPKQ